MVTTMVVWKLPEGEKALSVEPSLAELIVIKITDRSHTFIS